MKDLAGLAAAAIGFAAGEHLAIVPAVPQHDYGPEVCLCPDEMDLPGFLALDGRLGGGVLYLRAWVQPADVAGPRGAARPGPEARPDGHGPASGLF